MKLALKLLSLCLVFLLATVPSFAQDPTGIMTEASDPNEDRPLDDIVEPVINYEKRVLPYEPLREADIFWKKRIWRVIDTREKMNQPFSYPERPFFEILMEGAINGDITVYSTETDKFENALTPEEVASKGASVDTVITFDPETYEEQIEVVRNDINYEDVRRFRLKEMWYFDEEASVMKVRILGIAPLLDVNDDQGNFKYELPMFWAYYPDCREILAREPVFNFGGNDASPVTWEDLFEMRFFSSYIFKESNVRDERLQDYLSGVDLLLEADKIKSQIFNFEHDLWSY